MANVDLRLWSREVIKDFIDLYKSHSCLWDVESEGYNNKYAKSLAYKELVQFCKKKGFPEANRDFVVRKLQSLRGSFRKELRKLETYQKAGKSYESNLWYFNNLMFTIGNSSEGDEQQSDGNVQSGDDYDDDDSKGDDEKFSIEEKLGTIIVTPNYTSESLKPPSPPPKKRKRLSENCPQIPQPEFFDIGQETKKELSEFELTGMNIAKKLARMDETQAIYAESLINSVIRKGLLKKLKEETDLCDNLCGRRTVGVNLPSQSISSEAGSSR